MSKIATKHLRNWALRASFLALPVAYVLLSSHSSGISGQSTAGCNCHGPNTPSTLLTLAGIPAAGWVPGQAYNLTATVTNNARSGAGFNLSVSDGSISNAGAGATLVNATEIRHNARKAMASGSASWTFTWTAPAGGTSVDFNFAGNAVNSDGSSNGDSPNQTTLTYNVAATTSRPTATTDPATAISHTTAILNGTANANGNNGVTASFEYGTTSALGSTAAATPAIISGTTATAVTANIAALAPATTYFYRLKLSSALGADSGAVRSFTTASNAPVFGSPSATAITNSGATVSASSTPNNNATAYGVKYGTSAAFGLTATTTPASGSGNTPITVSAALTGLLPNTKYYYAFTATVSGAITSSATDSFTTRPLGITNVAPELVAVYPNPTQTALEWSLPAGVQVQRAQAFSVSGQRVALPFAQAGGNTMKADVSGLAPGVYYLLLDAEGRKYGASFRKN